MRLIQKWLNAGVLEDGKRIQSEVGTVQGGSVSPLLANVYLHYVFDLWVQRWRRWQARGEVVVVRFADDFVLGFEHREEAERFLAVFANASPGLGWRCIPRRPDSSSSAASRPNIAETVVREAAYLQFLGFTHCCARTRKGRIVLRQTMRQRWQAKLQAVKIELRRRLHRPSPKWELICERSSGPRELLRGPQECPALGSFTARSRDSGGGCFSAAVRRTTCSGRG